jgi:hypothetical protein
MRHLLLALPLLLMQPPLVVAQVSVGIGIELPGVRIGVDLPSYPDMQRVPGYPVYYAPQAPANFFFYDGLYWVFEGDTWYSSAWYNGPWHRIEPDAVPLYVLRVPVRYYRQPPPFFRSWRADAPPRWNQHWGNDWAQRRKGWDRWNHGAAPPPAPLPTYQRQYPHSRYPQEAARQHSLRAENYTYQSRDPTAHRQPPQAPAAPVHRVRQDRDATAQTKRATPPTRSGSDTERVAPSQGGEGKGNQTPTKQNNGKKDERESKGHGGR